MKLKEQIDRLVFRVDSMSLRERALIFAAAAFLLVSLIDSLLLNPLSQQQKALSAQVVQQQEKMKEVQAQLAGGEAYLKDRRDKLVPPERMAALLEQMLARNGRLQLVAMNTLPVTLFNEQPTDAAAAEAGTQEGLMYKHGVRITVRGSYADLLQYLTALEKLPTRMFWGEAKLSVVQYPASELTLTLYTLSLEKTWLQV